MVKAGQTNERMGEVDEPRLTFDAAGSRAAAWSEPLGFAHNLHELDLFGDDSLRALTAKYVDRDYFVAASAPSPAAEFYSVPSGELNPSDALERLDSRDLRILLKRPERYDARFRRLLDMLFASVVERRGGFAGDRVVRLESGIFLSSAAAVTPFHFDPEVTFFHQIEGEKIYHVFSPRSLAEPELERFYVKGIVNIGQTSFVRRDAGAEHVFELVPGMGMYQPQNAPHWVETRGTRSISYAFSFETDRMRAVNRTRSFNHYQRALGVKPSPPGTHRGIDSLKASAMDAVIPARKTLRRIATTALAPFARQR